MKNTMKAIMVAAILAVGFTGVAQAGTLYYCDAPAVDTVGLVLPISGGPSLRSAPDEQPHIIVAWAEMVTKSYSKDKAVKVYYDYGSRIIWAVQLTKRICLQ